MIKKLILGVAVFYCNETNGKICTDYPRESKKARLDSEPQDIEQRLQSLIMRVGEKSISSLESNLETLAKVMESDLAAYRSKIMRFLSECENRKVLLILDNCPAHHIPEKLENIQVVFLPPNATAKLQPMDMGIILDIKRKYRMSVIKMPAKTTIYSTLVGLLNAKNYNFGGEFVEHMIHHLNEALKTGNFDQARTIIRFLADLVNCYVIFSNSFLTLASSLLDVTLETGTPQVRSDWYVYTILSSLPLVGRELYEKKDQELDHLLRTIESYINKRHKIHHPALRVWETDTPHLQEEYLDCLWLQVNKLREDKWIEHHILRPYQAFDNQLCEALQHSIPSITPPLHRESTKYPYPQVVFRLFDYTDCPENVVLPGAHSIDRFYIEEQLRLILQSHHKDRAECASLLLSLPDKPKIPLEYMIVEVIMGELFRLPVSNYRIICLGSILIELSKLVPDTIPLALAQAVQLIYERLETMNIECIDRFSQWLAYHLSNFQMKWSWDIWSDCLSLDTLHPKTKFVSECFNRCLRLFYHQKIVDCMPETFASLLPPNPLPYCKYFQEGSANLTGAKVAHQLQEAINDRAGSDELLAILREIPEDDRDQVPNRVRIDILVQVLLHIGSKSVTHSAARLAKYSSAFSTLVTCEEAQQCVLHSTYEIWRFNQQMLCLLVNKYLKLKIIECSAVVNWIFSKQMAPEFTKFYIWEILHATNRWMIKQVAQLQKQSSQARNHLRRDSDSEDDDDEDDYRSGGSRLTDEQVEQLEAQLDTAQQDQKKLFLIVFQHFIIILTEHIAECEKTEINFNNLWFKWALGRLQSIFFIHYDVVYKYASTLETIMFTNETDSHLLSIFHRFLSLQT
ncbi:NCBP1 [Cordylochernes scorpioides]|uniref:Nuclear cap-binding protein subunit 1 n=1 Tax=Cordylochernes scorpioides TaxID=51811 RepID=A0ABY6K2P6_9ARAC|nr:NCBP1 [Cordylochernes scorpioides]